eukprot:CAMPEP_0203967116 /NCGR_PEP_ID=MMETSP0359-20131031/96184_1 /ASSEMBLY_ACC=CAM_ASM_000338 /TAXON_ID=268821 /ORGANISM="Scrippsiella Hangoei, Strain SHTV-5" /LENGTH=52 /DNA_ID=CAMNT_0050904837 /DNA_START=40 /DNA_END=194 /DNA_ORIENTATION=+
MAEQGQARRSTREQIEQRAHKRCTGTSRQREAKQQSTGNTMTSRALTPTTNR